MNKEQKQLLYSELLKMFEEPKFSEIDRAFNWFNIIIIFALDWNIFIKLLVVLGVSYFKNKYKAYMILKLKQVIK